jgi:hypothetical protein
VVSVSGTFLLARCNDSRIGMELGASELQRSQAGMAKSHCGVRRRVRRKQNMRRDVCWFYGFRHDFADKNSRSELEQMKCREASVGMIRIFL